MSREEQATRAVALVALELERGHAVTARQVSDRFGCHIRTAQRWLEMVDLYVMPLSREKYARKAAIWRKA